MFEKLIKRERFSSSTKVYSILPHLSSTPLNTPQTVDKEYMMAKRTVMYYRSIFLFLGVLFSILAATIYFHSPHWNFTLLFGYGVALKTLFCLMTFCFAIAALWMGCSLRTEHEIVRFYFKRTKSRIKRNYLRKKMPIHWGTFLVTQETAMKSKNLRLAYLDALDEIERVSQDVDYKLDLINHDHTLPESSKLPRKLELISSLKNFFDLVLLKFESH